MLCYVHSHTISFLLPPPSHFPPMFSLPPPSFSLPPFSLPHSPTSLLLPPRLKKSSTLRRGDCFKQKKEKLLIILREKRNNWNYRERCTKKISICLLAILSPPPLPSSTHTCNTHSQHSNQLNQARLTVLKARDDHVKVVTIN